jgi:hypothetical protein
MSRAVKTGSADQSIRVWAYDSAGDAITGEAYNSAGIAVSVVVRANGRILSTTALTLVARSGVGVHTDSAFTEVGNGEYVVDLPDSYSATAERQVSVTLTSASISGGHVLSETLAIGQAAELDSAATAALVDLIWDEPLTGATHNVATSSGKRLRQTTAFQQIESTVVDASATTTTFVTGLDSAVDNFYNDSMLVFTDGALAGQVRSIVDYVGATKTIVLEEPLTSVPVNGVAFTIVSLHIHPVSQIQSGLATAAALSTVEGKLDTIDDFLDTEVLAIKAKTDNLPTDPADQSLVEAAITAATSPLATPAQVNAQVLDVLSVDTFAELSAPPAATSSLKDKITWLFMYARNKVTQTAIARTLYRDDTTTVAGTSTTSDNGTTFTKGEDA